MASEELSFRLMAAYLAEHPLEAARQLENMPAQRSAAVLGSSAPDIAVRVFAEMGPYEASTALGQLPHGTATQVLELLPPNSAANLLRRLETGPRRELLDALSSDVREPLERVLRFPAGSVGAIMDPAVFSLPGDLDVESATARIRRNANRIRYYVYVLDGSQRLSGVLNLRDFILAEPNQLVREIMTERVASLPSEMLLRELRSSARAAPFRSMPVVDKERRLLGVVSAEALQQNQPAPSAAPGPWDTVLALSELYWVGLSGMIGFGPPYATAATKRHGTDQGGSNGE